jgi:hypothetical protein
MTIAPVRDSLADHVLTPENAAFLQWDSSTAAKVAQTISRTLQQFGVCHRRVDAELTQTAGGGR